MVSVPRNLIVHETVKSKTSNNEYDVFIFDNCITCTCPAGGKKQLCKHLISTIHKNLELINNVNPGFCKQLVNLIELKQNKNIPQNEKLEEYAKFIFVNKEISTLAHKHTQEIRDSDIRELEELAELFQENKWLSVNFYNFVHTAQKNPYSIFVALKNNGLEKLEKLGYIQFCSLEQYCDNYMELENYCAFNATELLTTNTKIAGFARGFKNFRYKHIEGDIGIKLLLEDSNIVIK